MIRRCPWSARSTKSAGALVVSWSVTALVGLALDASGPGGRDSQELLGAIEVILKLLPRGATHCVVPLRLGLERAEQVVLSLHKAMVSR